MSDHIDTRDGWTSVDVSDPNSVVYSLAEYGPDGELVAAWVREEQAPALPTASYTVILADFLPDDPGVIYVLIEGGWFEPGAKSYITPDELAKRIRGFEVLAEPQQPMTAAVLAAEYARGRQAAERAAAEINRETAKAVLDRVRPYGPTEATRKHFDQVAREFGVDQ